MCARRRGCVLPCTFDQTFIIGPCSLLDFEPLLSSCQPTTLLLYFFLILCRVGNCMEMPQTTQQNAPVIRFFFFFRGTLLSFFREYWQTLCAGKYFVCTRCVSCVCVASFVQLCQCASLIRSLLLFLDTSRSI